MKKLLVLAASAGLSVGFMGSVAVAQPLIDTTGPKSTNKIVVSDKQKCVLMNNNVVGLDNAVSQKSKTGTAKVKNNTTAGEATSGAAGNTNTTAATVNLTNSTDTLVCPEGSVLVDATDSTISNTGRKSLNVIKVTNSSTLKVVNNNTIGIGNSVWQGASSGGAIVQGNTTGGSATSGNSTNSNSSVFTITVTN